MRFRTRTAFSRNLSRSSAATRSFSLRTFCCNSTLAIVFHLYVGQVQFVPPYTVGVERTAVRAFQCIVVYYEVHFASAAAVPALDEFHLEFQAFELRFTSQRFKTKL